MKPDLFLTGASGLLGTRLLTLLEPRDFGTITLLSRRELRLPPALAAADNVRVIHASLHESERYAPAFTRATCIVHLAAVTGKADRPQYFAVNTHATRQLVGAAVNAQVNGLLFASSIAVSFRDRQGYHYAESKQQAEQLIADSGLRYCIMRPTIILGAGSPVWRSFLGLARRNLIVLPGSGRVRIQPVFVDDLARLVLEFVAADRFDDETLEVGGPEALSLDDFVRRIHAAQGGGRAWVLHLPLALVLGPLRLLESFLGARLPVASGQFASFANDGTVSANAPVNPSGASMLDVDAMLERLLAVGRAETAGGECAVFARYLSGRPPANWVCDRYQEALQRQPEALAVRSRFDGWLLRLGGRHPLLTRMADLHARFFCADAALRRRLVMLLAIMETHAPTVTLLDRADGGVLRFVSGLAWRSATASILLACAILLLLPLQLALNLGGARE